MDRVKISLKQVGSTAAMLVVCLVVIAVGELLPPLRGVDSVFAANPVLIQALLAVTISMTVAGVFLLAFTQFLVRVPDSRRDHGAVARLAPGETRGWSARFFYGVTASAGFHDDARMWQLKRAFQNGDWWRKPRWRRFTLMGLGAVLLVYGMFGLFFIIFPPGIKLLVALAVLYATARTVWAFKQDKPFREAQETKEEDS
jgi:uncharacterized membrane protein